MNTSGGAPPEIMEQVTQSMNTFKLSESINGDTKEITEEEGALSSNNEEEKKRQEKRQEEKKRQEKRQEKKKRHEEKKRQELLKLHYARVAKRALKKMRGFLNVP